jgi:hypothetical protein
MRCTPPGDRSGCYQLRDAAPDSHGGPGDDVLAIADTARRDHNLSGAQ